MPKIASLVLMAAVVFLSSCGNGSPNAQAGDRPNQGINASTAQPFSTETYAAVLKNRVNAAGLVDYLALQANPQPLKKVVAAIGAVSPQTYAAWNEKEKIAFLLNAYNAITLESIIDQKPLKKSIKDIWGVWNQNKHTVAGEFKTLDNIEHQTLRMQFNEPRIHAALVCAALSCPPLRQEPYTSLKLDAQLDDQVGKWLSGQGLRIDRAQNRVFISSIFDWFGKDWQKQYGVEDKFAGNAKERSVLNFISRYVSAEDSDYLAKGKYKLSYLKYDWALNKQ